MIEIDYDSFTGPNYNKIEEIKNKYPYAIVILRTELKSNRDYKLVLSFQDPETLPIKLIGNANVPDTYYEGIKAIGVDTTQFNTMESLIDHILSIMFG